MLLSFFLKELLGLFRYPPGSGRALLAGTLPLRYSAARFANRTPTWRLPVFGHVFGLTAAGVVQEALADGRQEVHWVSGSEPGRKRIRLNRKKNPAHFACFMGSSRPRVWKRLRRVGIPVFPFLIPKGGYVIKMMRDTFLIRSGLEWGNSLGFVQAHVSRFARFFLLSQQHQTTTNHHTNQQTTPNQ